MGSVPGTQVRRIQYQMKLPAEVPAAMKRLVSIPEDTSVNVLLRLGVTDERVLVLRETQALDAPFGTHFWTSEALACTPDAEGVKIEMWCAIRWVASLPWYASPVSGYIEQTIVDASKKSGP